MDELIEVPVEPVPVPVPVTTGSLVRDAIFDLGAALCTGFSVILAGAIGAALVLVFTGRDPRGIVDVAASPWGIAAMLLCTQLPLLYFALRRRRRNREKHRPVPELFKPGTFHTIPIGVIAGLGLTVLSALYSGTVQRVLGEGSVQNQVEFLQDILDNKPAVALLIFIIAVLAPICEETFFRGVIFGSGGAAGFSSAGIAISATLFAAVHGIPLLVPFYAFFAFVMCRLYARTGTLAAPIAAHMTMNGVACAALIFAGNRV